MALLAMLLIITAFYLMVALRMVVFSRVGPVLSRFLISSRVKLKIIWFKHIEPFGMSTQVTLWSKARRIDELVTQKMNSGPSGIVAHSCTCSVGVTSIWDAWTRPRSQNYLISQHVSQNYDAA